MSYIPPNPNGQALMINSAPVVFASNQSALPVTGSFYQATQPVSIASMPTTPVTGTFFQATQPVSLATNTPDVIDRAGRLLGVVSITGTIPVSGSFFQATQPVSIASMPTTPVTGTFFQATQPVSIAAMPTTPVTGTFFQATQPVSIAAMPTTPITPPPITKGTQGTTGIATQNLKDAGRARVSIIFQAVAPAVADTLLSLVKSTNGVAAVGAVSIGVTAGKTLRIIGIAFSLKSGAAAAAFGTLTLRINPAGATVIGSQSELRLDVGNTAATIGAADKVEHIIPDGFELSGTQTLGISLAAQAVTNVISITVTGFEY